MKNFTESDHCKSRSVCHLCRDKNNGRWFREEFKKHFILPDNEVDFECPFGAQWGDTVGPEIPKIDKPQKGLFKAPDYRSNFGNAWSNILHEKFGAVPCGECKKMITMLNNMDLETIKNKKDEIIDNVMTRSDQLPSKWQQYLVKLLPELAKKELSKTFDTALEKCSG